MVASLGGDNLQIYYYLCASEIWPNNWSGHVWLYKNGITVYTHVYVVAVIPQKKKNILLYMLMLLLTF
jgi:hypothetical protein